MFYFKKKNKCESPKRVVGTLNPKLWRGTSIIDAIVTFSICSFYYCESPRGVVGTLNPKHVFHLTTNDFKLKNLKNVLNVQVLSRPNPWIRQWLLCEIGSYARRIGTVQCFFFFFKKTLTLSNVSLEDIHICQIQN